MKEVKLEKVRKVEIEHECYQYSKVIITDIEGMYEVINYLASKGIKILNIKYFE